MPDTDELMRPGNIEWREATPTIRDQFAAMALTGVMGQLDFRQGVNIASAAYAIADAMMAERKARYAAGK